MANLKRAVHMTRFGPWAGVASPGIGSGGNLPLHRGASAAEQIRKAGYYARQVSMDETGRVYETPTNFYTGDQILVTASPLPGDSFKAVPQQFSVAIGPRVGPTASPDESTESTDAPGETWRSMTTAAIGNIESWIAGAPDADVARTNAPDYLTEPDAEGNPVRVVVNGKHAKLESNFFTAPEWTTAYTTDTGRLRTCSLVPEPEITPVAWSGTNDYWNGQAQMQWVIPPVTRIDRQFDTVWVEGPLEYTVYAKSTADALQEAYEVARDLHNAKLEEALLQTSRGEALTPAQRTALLTRPVASTHEVVKDEADVWWAKNVALTTELAKVQTVTGVTDANIREKFPRGAAGMTIDELAAHVAAQRAAGNTASTSEIISAITAPADQKTNQPWWSRVLDTVDGFGAGAKEVLVNWGPAGTVGVYGGVKAVDGVSAGNSNWLWFALIAGGVILLLK